MFSACTQNVVLSRASRSHKDSSARSVRANRDGICTMKQCSSAFLQFLFSCYCDSLYVYKEKDGYKISILMYTYEVKYI